MKISSYLFLSIAALTGLASCSTDADSPVQGEGSGSPVVVRAAVGAGNASTRSNPEAIGDNAKLSAFTPGDEIYVNDGKQGAEYTLADDGTTWNYSSNTYLTWHSQEMTFTAQYPTKDFVKVEEDQSTLVALKANDYMKATETVDKEPADHTITLSFKRQTARVIVNIAGYNSQFSDPDHITVSDMTFHASATVGTPTDASAIKPYTATANKTYIALVCPTSQNVANFLTFTVTPQGGEASTLQVDGIPELKAGMSYTFNVTVGKDKAEIVSVSVNPWTEQTLDISEDESTFSENPFAAITSQEDVGKIVTTDGKLYNTYNEAMQAGKTPLAMVAYVGETGDATYSHGLAIAFSNATTSNANEYGEDFPENAVEAIGDYYDTPSTTSGWKLPSIADIKRMTAAAGDNNDENEVSFELPKLNGYTIWVGNNFKTKLDDCISGSSNLKPLVDKRLDPSGGYNTYAYGFILTSDKPAGQANQYYVYDAGNGSFRLFDRYDATFNQEFKGIDQNEASVAIRPIFAF